MASLNYCGIPVFVRLSSTCDCSLYVRVGSNADSNVRYAFIYDDCMISRFPHLSDEDLFKCICALKRKYNLS